MLISLSTAINTAIKIANANIFFSDHKCGYCSLLPNLLTGYGWNPGEKIYELFGDYLALKCKDKADIKNKKDVTFKQVIIVLNFPLKILILVICVIQSIYPPII